MKNTTKHAGVVAAVLTAAGITGACPGTAFADSSPSSQVPHALGGGISQQVGSDHRGGDDRPIVVHGPILDGGPILHRGPGRRGDDDGRGRRGDHDGRGRYGDNDRRGYGDDDGWGRFDGDDRVVVSRIPVQHIVEDQWVSESQTGTICSVAGGNIVVDGADGTTWTWSTGTATTFRVVGVAGTLADLRVGEKILITGLMNGTARQAQTVVTVGDPSAFVTTGDPAAFVTVDRPAYVTVGHREILRRHERFGRGERGERGENCEHVGQHRRGDHCEHESGHRGHGRGGRHRS